MSTPIQSSDDMLAALREHKEWRDAVRRELLTQDLFDLPAKFEKAERERKKETRKAEREREKRQKKVWEAIDKLAEAHRLTGVTLRETNVTLKAFAESTEKRFGEVEERLDGLETGLRETNATLKAFMESTEKRFAAIESLEEQMLIKLRELDGGIIEIRSVRKLGNYLYDQMDRLEVLDQRTLNQATDIALMEGVITRDERRRVGAADGLAAGEDVATGEPACAAVEASGLVEKDDVDRAADRAALLLKILRKAVAYKPSKFADLFSSPPTKSYALVVGREITDAARREAEQKGVLFARYHNGYHLEGR